MLQRLRQVRMLVLVAVAVAGVGVVARATTARLDAEQRGRPACSDELLDGRAQ
jgi:hypothetical protein